MCHNNVGNPECDKEQGAGHNRSSYLTSGGDKSTDVLVLQLNFFSCFAIRWKLVSNTLLKSALTMILGKARREKTKKLSLLPTTEPSLHPQVRTEWGPFLRISARLNRVSYTYPIHFVYFPSTRVCTFISHIPPSPPHSSLFLFSFISLLLLLFHLSSSSLILIPPTITQTPSLLSPVSLKHSGVFHPFFSAQPVITPGLRPPAPPPPPPPPQIRTGTSLIDWPKDEKW